MSRRMGLATRNTSSTIRAPNSHRDGSAKRLAGRGATAASSAPGTAAIDSDPEGVAPEFDHFREHLDRLLGCRAQEDPGRIVEAEDTGARLGTGPLGDAVALDRELVGLLG